MINKVLDYFTQVDNWITVCTVIYTLYSVFKNTYKTIKIWVRRKSLKKLLGCESVTIHIPTRKNEDRIKPVIAMEDYNTAEKIRTILCENDFETCIKYIPVDGEIEFDSKKANIVVCGPKNSTKISELFDSFEYLKFAKDEEKDEWFFEDKKTESKLYSAQESKTEQYAFLGKVDFSEHKFILICGIHAIGSDGVAYFLSDSKRMDDLLKKVKNNMFWCIISSSYGDHDRQIYDADLTNHIYVIEGKKG